jgi:hypothetical protein
MDTTAKDEENWNRNLFPEELSVFVVFYLRCRARFCPLYLGRPMYVWFFFLET